MDHLLDLPCGKVDKIKNRPDEVGLINGNRATKALLAKRTVIGIHVSIFTIDSLQ